MPLIKRGRLVADPWVMPDQDAPVPAGGPVIVSLERWQAEAAALRQRCDGLGLVLRPDQPPSLIADDLQCFELIAVAFPAFTDGRAYSTARLLRERHGYEGELRAVGEVLRDQFLFMHRCGFDAFEVADESAVDGWLEAMSEIDVWYQPTGDGRPSITALRHPPVTQTPRSGNAKADFRQAHETASLDFFAVDQGGRYVIRRRRPKARSSISSPPRTATDG